MKKLLLISAMFMVGSAVAWATDASEPSEPPTSSEPAHLTSTPYHGSIPNYNKNYYLYNVKTDTWIDANDQVPYQWDTTAALNHIGMDFTVDIENELICFYSNISLGGSLSGADAGIENEFSLNNGEFKKWRVKYNASTVDGKEIITCNIYVNKDEAKTSHSYNLSAKWDESLRCYRLHRDIITEDGNAPATDCTGLSEWQFVTREERLEAMKATAEANPGTEVDATWLIPNHSMITYNNRDTELWKGSTPWPEFVAWKNLNETVGVDEDNDGTIDNDSRGLISRESWQGTIDRYAAIEGLPEGTYSYSISGFYRDGDPWAGGPTEAPFTNRAWYYAGGSARKIMNIMDDAEDEVNIAAGYNGNINGKICPTYGAGVAFKNGRYKNIPIATYVSDNGKLVVGLWKSEVFTGDSFNFKQMHLTYMTGTAVDEKTDKDALDNRLKPLITEAAQYQGATAAKEEAEKALSDGTASDKMAAIRRIADAIRLYVKTDDIYRRTKALCPSGTDVSKADALYNSARSEADVSLALQTLRGIRRHAMNVRRIPDTFEGATTMEANTKYFLYNVGEQLFFDGGAEWGVHPMLDNPGAEFTPVNPEATDGGGFKCILSTNFVGLDTETAHYLSYYGSLDGILKDTWEFVPVEGQDNLFFIRLASSEYAYAGNEIGNYIVFAGRAPSVNLQGTNANPQWCERTVEYMAKEKDVDLASPDSWWKIVPVESRQSFETASTETPFDISYMIANPGFNRILNRAYPDAWTTTGADFSMSKWVNGTGNAQWNWNLSETAEASNLIPSQFEISQTLENMPDGVYMFECSGYYRDGAYSEEKPIQFFCEAAPAVDSEAAACDNAAAIAEGDDVPADTDNKAAVNLCNVLDFADYAPGEGTAVIKGDKTIEVPGDFLQSAAYYRSGLYKNYLVVNVNSGTAGKRSDIKIGVKHSDPTASQAAGSYINLDDFRGTYYGPDATVKDANDSIITGIDDITDDATTDDDADNRIFNLQGIEVANPSTPGIYIRNGRKFIIR